MKLAAMEGLLQGQKANGLGSVWHSRSQGKKKRVMGEKNNFAFKVKKIPGMLSMMGYRNIDAICSRG